MGFLRFFRPRTSKKKTSHTQRLEPPGQIIGRIASGPDVIGTVPPFRYNQELAEKSPFLRCSAEIRTAIYEACIQVALEDGKDVYRYWSFLDSRKVGPSVVLKEITHTNGNVEVRMDDLTIGIAGMGPLPLLFANVQVYHELYCLVMPYFTGLHATLALSQDRSMFQHASLHEYNPLFRWPLIQSSLRQLKFTILLKGDAGLEPGSQAEADAKAGKNVAHWLTFKDIDAFTDRLEFLGKVVVGNNLDQTNYGSLTDERLVGESVGQWVRRYRLKLDI